jgi:MFS family permease
MLVSSIATGRIIQRIGRYRPFPIIGTALMTIGLALLATLKLDTAVAVACGFVMLLGFGMGLVMQVLVLAVQNAVEHRHLGVGTSGATLFRTIGGTVGVSVFGAIFTATLTSGLAVLLPAGSPIPTATAPAAIQALPAAERTIYLQAFTAALHPVFLYAAAIAAVGFVLTWFLKSLPLRGGAPVRPKG